MSQEIQGVARNGASPVSGPVQVSVVIPAYQCAAYIADTLKSVQAQTFRSFEILVVNDGSPDTEALEQALAPYLPAIRYIKQANGGPSAARNRGISEARGEFVAFLDSDDFWLPEHLANQIQLLQGDPSLKMVYSDAILLRDDLPVGTAFERVHQQLEVTFEALVSERCSIGTSTVVVSRKTLLECGGFEPARRRSEDFDLWLRIAHSGAQIGYSRSAQVCHRIGNGLAMDDNVMRQAQIDVYEKALLTLPIQGPQAELLCDKIQEVRARLQVETAKRSLRQGRYQDALAALRDANGSVKSAKLSIAAVGLQYFPRAFAAGYEAYDRFLERKESQKQGRFRAGKNGAVSLTDYQALAGIAQK